MPPVGVAGLNALEGWVCLCTQDTSATLALELVRKGNVIYTVPASWRPTGSPASSRHRTAPPPPRRPGAAADAEAKWHQWKKEREEQARAGTGGGSSGHQKHASFGGYNPLVHDPMASRKRKEALEVLGLPAMSTTIELAELKVAYRKQALRWHPVPALVHPAAVLLIATNTRW
eukprot:SAG31_NODE_1408_length_8473_cov_2.276809_2_plen_174_part_00